ncbi:MAG TPA: SHOCT domain-containing protein [Gemmatimonadaceae bacterium]|nr:SHOCT domain-containing protein [Gemmatimonadaceae bacterium]
MSTSAQPSSPNSPPPTGQVVTDPHLIPVLQHLQSLLIPGEKLEAYAVQRRLFALTHRRLIIGATSGRLISVTRGLFGSFHPVAVRWQDLEEVRVDVGTFGASLFLKFLSNRDFAGGGQTMSSVFTGLRKDEAERVYRICQQQDQAWREKRRVRELEELRAKSGGVQIGSTASPVGAGAAPSDGDPAARLERAKTMLEQGLISDSEYESLKAKIVNSL